MSPAGGEWEPAAASSAAEPTGILQGSAKCSHDKRRNNGGGGVVEGEERPGISTATLSINHDPDTQDNSPTFLCAISYRCYATMSPHRKQHAKSHV